MGNLRAPILNATNDIVHHCGNIPSAGFQNKNRLLYDSGSSCSILVAMYSKNETLMVKQDQVDP